MPRQRAPRPPPPPLTPLSQRVALSHPDRLVWPEEGLRKIDLARYYAEVAPFLTSARCRPPRDLRRLPTGPRGALLLPARPPG